MRKLFAALFLIGALVVAPCAAHASTIYDLTLTDWSTALDGTGTLTVANSGNGAFSVTAGTLTGLDIIIGGEEFTLDNAINSGTNATIAGGALQSLAYTGTADAGKVVFTFTSGSIYYTFSGTNGAYESGYMNARFDRNVTDPPPVPEPSTLALMGSGLAGLATFARRKMLRS
jgi:hypothetical protein